MIEYQSFIGECLSFVNEYQKLNNKSLSRMSKYQNLISESLSIKIRSLQVEESIYQTAHRKRGVRDEFWSAK